MNRPKTSKHIKRKEPGLVFGQIIHSRVHELFPPFDLLVFQILRATARHKLVINYLKLGRASEWSRNYM